MVEFGITSPPFVKVEIHRSKRNIWRTHLSESIGKRLLDIENPGKTWGVASHSCRLLLDWEIQLSVG